MAMRERHSSRKPGKEDGFALILAILALLLLTFLGLTLALTTSTELQIATNYRWSQQALYNAEAGLELARDYLRQVEWTDVVPLSRSLSDMTSPPPAYGSRPGPNGEPSRDFEMLDCDTTADVTSGKGNQGLGIILDSATFASPWQNTSTFLGQTLNGTFTVWVRRPLRWDKDAAPDGAWLDDDWEDEQTIILTSEGTAPYPNASSVTTMALSNRAIRYIEQTVQKVDPTRCENLNGQVGAGPTGAGFDQCGQLLASQLGATESDANKAIQ